MEIQVYFNTTWSIFLWVFFVLYKVFSVYCTLHQTEKSSVNKEDFRFKEDLMRQKPFLNLLKLKVNLKRGGSIRF